MKIRKAEIDDASKIRDLVLSLSHFYFEDENASLPNWFENSLTILEFQSRLSDPIFTNVVYLESDVIVAYISVKSESHIYHLFVAEAFQGKGIANKLWAYIKSQLPANEYTVRSSISAIPVYKSFGFEETGPASSKEGMCFQEMRLRTKV